MASMPVQSKAGLVSTTILSTKLYVPPHST
jgi:hypothetical protein